jgi:hypothetical protein
LSAQVEVARSLEFVVLSKLVKVANLLVSVSTELAGVRLKASVQVLGAEDLLLDILKEELLVSELVAAGINDLLGVIDSQVHSREIVVELLESLGLVGSLSNSVLV